MSSFCKNNKLWKCLSTQLKFHENQKVALRKLVKSKLNASKTLAIQSSSLVEQIKEKFIKSYGNCLRNKMDNYQIV